MEKKTIWLIKHTISVLHYIVRKTGDRKYKHILAIYSSYFPIAEKPGPYLTWVTNICRIFFATRNDSSAISKMDRKWMLDVMDPPSVDNNKELPMTPLTVQFKCKTDSSKKTTSENKEPKPVEKQIQSTVILPNNALMDEETPDFHIETKDYIQKILTENENWKQRVNHVHLPKAKSPVNAVSPIHQDKQKDERNENNHPTEAVASRENESNTTSQTYNANSTESEAMSTNEDEDANDFSYEAFLPQMHSSPVMTPSDNLSDPEQICSQEATTENNVPTSTEERKLPVMINCT